MRLSINSGQAYEASIESAVERMVRWLMDHGEHVDTGHWQAVKDVPQTQTIEMPNAVFQIYVPPTSGALASYCQPNLPWAEDHFQERVSGEPLNPGEQYKNWPYYKGNVEQHRKHQELDPELHSGYGVNVSEPKFSHTYMERFWPRHANDPDDPKNGGSGGIVNYWEHNGIRYRYGDLNDVLGLLAREPYTRQAYLPVWFPEDTGAHAGERVPCTLGYHFMLRKKSLHCVYPIRSCDLLRHFKDDVYMAGRLMQWVISNLANPTTHRAEGPDDWTLWQSVQPGTLTLMIPSLHIFEGDLPMLRKKYPGTVSER